jgi:hypothetical protein
MMMCSKNMAKNSQHDHQKPSRKKVDGYRNSLIPNAYGGVSHQNHQIS